MPPLSRTEEKVLGLYYQGMLYKEMSDVLPASIDTIKTHMRRIIKKTGAKNGRQAAYLWRENHQLRLQL